VAQRHHRLKLDELTLDWGIPAALLTPAVWPSMLWRNPLGRTQIFGPLGADGDFIEALKKRWKILLDCSDREVEQIKQWFVTLWSLLDITRRASKREECSTV
jgi:hypothetical protein